MNADAKAARRVFFDLPQEAANPADAAAVILPVPYDATASWIKGSAGAPEAILEASQHVELWDVETGSEPWRYGIAGVEPVEFEGRPEDLADEVADRVRGLLSNGRLPIVLGGEHSVTIGAVRAAAEAHPRLDAYRWSLKQLQFF